MADPALARPGWIARHLPTRERVERSRWLRPIAARVLTPSLWRFTRRSVPRGVALGIAVGALLPFGHMPIAAALALTFRANVPVAVGTTWLNNPLTWVPLFGGALRIGRAVLGGGQHSAVVDPHKGWAQLLAHGSAELAIGLVVIAAVLTVAGYALTSLIWRLYVARRWRRRGHKRLIRCRD